MEGAVESPDRAGTLLGRVAVSRDVIEGGAAMVAVSRPSSERVMGMRPELLDRIARELPALLLVLTPIALLNVLIGTRPVAPPAPAELDAVVGASLGPGTSVLDIGFRAQLAVFQAVAGAGWSSSLLQSGRALCLLAGLLPAAMLWPLLRRLDLGGNAAATAVIVAGLAPLALRLQPNVDPGAVAGCWIALAAVVGFRVRPGAGRVLAVSTLLVAAVLSAPVAAAGLLALAAHTLLVARPGGLLRPAPRVTLAILAAVAAAGVVGWALLGNSTGGPGTAAVPLPTLIAILGLGALVLARAWVRRPDLRPVVTMIAVWLACSVGPDPARSTLLLAVPALALLVGALLSDVAADQGPRFSIAAATAVTVALVSGMVTVVWPVAPPAPSSYQPLARWLNGELDERVVLSAAPLDRAELVAAGVPAGRFAVDSVPAGAVTVVPSEAGCGELGSPVVRVASVAGALSVCAPPPPAADVVLSSGTGPLLAANPALETSEPARRLLLQDTVDSRLVAVLAGAALQHVLQIEDFPAVPGEPADTPRRMAVLRGIVAAVDVDGRPAASSLELHLNAQRPPFHPDVRPLSDGRLVVHFRLPGAAPVPPG
jgi:hypothetical protein